MRARTAEKYRSHNSAANEALQASKALGIPPDHEERCGVIYEPNPPSKQQAVEDGYARYHHQSTSSSAQAADAKITEDADTATSCKFHRKVGQP